MNDGSMQMLSLKRACSRFTLDTVSKAVGRKANLFHSARRVCGGKLASGLAYLQRPLLV